MELQKILNLLNEANDSKFVTRKHGTLPVIYQMQIMMKERKLSIIQKF